MIYTPTLRQIVLIPTVPVAFWLGSVLSHTKLVAASLARGPKHDELDPAAAQVAEAQQKKVATRTGLLMIVFQLAVYGLIFWAINTCPNALDIGFIIFYTFGVTVITQDLFVELFGTSRSLVYRPKAGILVHVSGPARWSVRRVARTLACMTLLPSILFFPSFLPAYAVASLGVLTCWIRGSPFGIKKDAKVSLRWTFFYFGAVEVAIVALSAALVFAIEQGWFDAVGRWLDQGADEDGSEKKSSDKAAPLLDNAMQEGRKFFQPLIWTATTGLIVAILYRMDVRISEDKTGRAIVSEDEFGWEEPIKIKGTQEVSTGQQIQLPALPAVLKKHLIAARHTPPVYFLVGTSLHTALFALLPVVLTSNQIAVKETETPTHRNAQVEGMASLIAALLSPWVIALAIGLVALARGQGKLVWNYTELWGGSKAAQEVDGGTEKFLLGGAEEKAATDTVA